MPNQNTALRKETLIAAGLGLAACAIPYWPVAYDKFNLMENTIYLGWVGFTIVASLAARVLTVRPIPPTALTVTAGFLAAMILRIIVECAIDPTDHNLWPFELVWGGMVALPSAFTGAWLAKFLMRTA